MNAAGIIAEYNPFHNGHAYSIKMARKLSGSDAVIVAMSGDYVQRGEPAITDKWTRAAMALENGADLVVEIPTVYCLGNAGQYAFGGVRLLESIGIVTHIAFGSESGNTDNLKRLAAFISESDQEIEAHIKQLSRAGISYPSARATAITELSGSRLQSAFVTRSNVSDILNSPNDILALEYLRASRSLKPVAIKRIGQGYNDPVCDPVCEYQSASGIRRLLKRSAAIDRYVPPNVAGILSGMPLTSAEDWWDILRYAVLSSESEEIEDCPSGGEGLGILMKKKILSADSFDSFIMAIKSKRYTYSRLSRLCMQVIMGIRRSDLCHDISTGCAEETPGRGICTPGYIRVLGFTANGRELLREIKNKDSAEIPIITNVNKEGRLIKECIGKGKRHLEMDIHAADIYNLVTGRDVRALSDYRMKPIEIF